MAQPRKRTDQQRKLSPEDKEDVGARPISEEEQDDVIRKLRTKAAGDKAFARKGLDMVVLVATFMTATKAIQMSELGAPGLLVLVLAVQALLLPLSLSPDWIKYASAREFMEANHLAVTVVQLTLFMVAYLGVGQDHGAGLTDMVRWAIPELVAGAVEWQRRSERDSEASLQRLEGLRYDLKGA